MKLPSLICALALYTTSILTSQSATIGSLVWQDLNQNGIQETNEPGLSNITVQLFNCENTNLIASVVTTNEGFFSFQGNYPSNVFLRVVLPSGYLITSRDRGDDDELDSDFDPITGSTHCFTLNCTNATSTNCVQTNWAIGLFQPVIGVAGPGFWKTHPSSWPETNITIAGVTYASSNAFELFRNGADKSLTLFRAVLAARLNELAGADVSCITQALAQAEQWLTEFPRGSGVRGSSEEWQLASPIVEDLEDYNEGKLCAPSRDDDDDVEEPAKPQKPRPVGNVNNGNNGGNGNGVGQGHGITNKLRHRIGSQVFVIQQSSNMVQWVDLTTVTNFSNIAEYFDDEFDADTNLVYRVVRIAQEGAEPVNVFTTVSTTGNRTTSELLPIVYEGDLIVRGNNNEVSGADEGETIITGDLIILGNNNRVSDLTVLGRVIIRGKRNSTENIEDGVTE
jgi:hypothetical protein